MNEREALLRAVCDNPDDDTPRLVFADWLQEHGEEERAEFIRLQVKRAHQTWNSPKWLECWNREKELLAFNEVAWRAELPVESGWVWGTFDRGFIGSLSVDPEDAPLSDPTRAFAATPLTELTFFEREIGRWMPYLWHIRVLVLGGCPLTDSDSQLLCSPELGLRLRRILIVGSNQFGPAAFDTLVTRYGRDAIEHF